MNVSYALRKIGELERAMAELYEFYATVFEEDEGARKLFIKMKRQEMRHYDQIQFQKRLLDPETEALDFPEDELRGIDESIKMVERHISEGVFELRDALRFAISVEEGAGELHMGSRIAQITPDLESLIKALRKEDRNHCVDLKAFTADFVRRSFS